MKKKPQCSLPLSAMRLILLALLLSESGLRSQEALRISMAGDFAAAERKQAANSVGYYNLLWGPASLRCSASVATEYTDNARNSSASGSDGDVITRPGIDADVHWPVTMQNSLDVSLGAGYSFYAKHSELNQFYLSPNSGVAFDVYIGDWVINLHDRANLSQNAYENPTTTNGVNTTYLQNSVGVSGLLDLNKVVVSIGFDHANYMSLDTTASGQPDSESENFYLNAGIRPREEILVGVEGGLGLVSYDRGGNTNLASALSADALQWNGGLFGSLQLSKNISARLDAGYTVYLPDKPSGTNSIADSTSLYFQLSLTHQVNEHISYSLSAGHSVDFAYNGQPYDRYFVRLNPDWNFMYKWNFGSSLSWEHGTQVGLGSFSFDQYTAGFSLGRQITQKLSGEIYYRWVTESAAQAVLNYSQNIVGLSLAYRF